MARSRAWHPTRKAPTTRPVRVGRIFPRARHAVLSIALTALAGWAGAPRPAAAQGGDPGAPPTLQVYVYRLAHQPAPEAVQLVRPLLSPQGTIELQPQANTVVIRDSLAALTRIVPVLRAFDHPVQPLHLEVLIVEAAPGGLSGDPRQELPEPLATRLRNLFRYERYQVVARAALEAREGEDVTYELGDGYVVNFRLGTLLADQRVRLNGFRILRAVEPERAKASPAFDARPLWNSNLNLWLDQTLVLTLTRSESSPRALMVAVTCSRPKGGPR